MGMGCDFEVLGSKEGSNVGRQVEHRPRSIVPSGLAQYLTIEHGVKTPCYYRWSLRDRGSGITEWHFPSTIVDEFPTSCKSAVSQGRRARNWRFCDSPGDL